MITHDLSHISLTSNLKDGFDIFGLIDTHIRSTLEVQDTEMLGRT